jgi:general secretion pathway protein C
MRKKVNLPNILTKWQIPKINAMKIPSFFMEAKRYQALLILLAIMLFTFQAVGIFYKYLGILIISPKEQRVVKEEAAIFKVVVKEPSDAYKLIMDRNLFGSTDKTLADKSAKTAETPPITSLIELKGTVAGDTKFGFAIMEEKAKKKQVLVKVGNTIAGATVLKIMRDKVIVKYMDKEETLKRAGSAESAILPPGKESAGGSAPAGSQANGSVTLSREEINSSMKDMGNMLSQAQVRPYFSAGVPDGFMVSSIRQGSIFQKMGLLDGDIIQGLNNRKVQSADDMMELYNNLRSGAGMSLSVKRGGKQESMNYTFK